MVSRKNPTWRFPDSGGGAFSGFSNAAMEHFKGQRLSSVVRETIQNSLDARKLEDRPVRVSFDSVELPLAECPEVADLKDSLESAYSSAKEVGDQRAMRFFKAAVGTLSDRSIGFMLIQDDNTTGLTGNTDRPPGAFFSLIKGDGLNCKATADPLGGFGHGSKAPFTFSKLRSVFYLSKIDSSSEVRFQGKSILQSHQSVHTGNQSQGTGFFGKSPESLAIFGDAVPKWASALRRKFSDDTGTTIFIPGATFDRSMYDAAALVAIANFSSAIRDGLLEVVIGDKHHIDKETVHSIYSQLRGVEDDMRVEVDLDALRAQLESAETLLGDQSVVVSGEQQWRSVGRVVWSLRLGDNVEGRSVAVARQTGMLITRQPPKLLRFPKTREFDLFICVKGESGSQMLRDLENPQHNALEFERIDDIAKRKEVKANYEKFVKEVRDLVATHAGVNTADSAVVTDLSHLFGDLNMDSKDTEASLERGQSLNVVYGSFNASRRSQAAKQFDPEGYSQGMVPGGGFRGGARKTRNSGGPNPGGKGSDIAGQVGEKKRNDRKVFKLEDLRVVQAPTREGYATVYFTAEVSGDFELRLFKSGELDSREGFSIQISSADSSAVVVSLIEGNRHSVTVYSEPSNFEAALEGWVYATSK